MSTPDFGFSVVSGHTVEEARLHGSEGVANGDLIVAAEAAGFEVFVTTDKTSGASRI